MAAPQPLRQLVWLGLALACAAIGCGKTINRVASEQLVLSDAVDRSVAAIDFRVLAGQKVFLDTAWIKEIKNNSFPNADYIIGSLRQQMVAAHCLLQERREDADYIVEARVGALGIDSHEVTYGLPANNLLTAASTIVPGAPPIPTIPEISAAKRSDQMAAAKIAVFAYERATREPVWQSGLSVAKSEAKDTWFIGAGPFQSGNIYKGTRFAGRKFRLPFFRREPEPPPDPDPPVAYDKEIRFDQTQPAPGQIASGPGEPAAAGPGYDPEANLEWAMPQVH